MTGPNRSINVSYDNMIILLMVTVLVLSIAAVINKVEVVQEDESQHQPQHLTRIAPDANSVDLELEQCPHCPAYVNASMK